MGFMPDLRRLARTLAQCVGLAAVYFVTARVGVSLATIGPNITLVWPPSGLALAALFLGGLRLWPGVVLGELTLNVLTSGIPFGSALGMSLGNAAEAVIGVLLLRRAGFETRFERVLDALVLIFGAAGLATISSATVGILSLFLGHQLQAAELLYAWRVWWLGDMMGILVVAPPILLWARPAWDPRSRLPEAATLALLLMVIAALVFGRRFDPISASFPEPYAVFPPLLWAALRFGPWGAAVASFVLSTFSVIGTAHGLGPFSTGSLDLSLLRLQAFMAIATSTTLIFAALGEERARAVEVREDIISISSHEINTPLTTLRLQLDRLSRALERDAGRPPATADLQQMARKADQQVDRLIKLVHDLLDMTRLRQGPLALNPTDTDLVRVVREAADELQPEMERAGCVLTLDLPPEERGRWDPGRLRQLVVNLLVNAAKYGSGEPIEVTLRAGDHMALLSVRDHGPGVPVSERSRIFGRFERVAGTAGVQGLGLGLYVAREIALAHGGRLRVESAPGDGACLVAELPRGLT